MSAFKMKCDHCKQKCKILHSYDVLTKREIKSRIQLCTECHIIYVLGLAEWVLKTNSKYKEEFLKRNPEDKEVSDE